MDYKLAIEVKNEEEKKKRKAIILVLSTITVLVSLVGASFAYYSANVNNTKGNQSIVLGATVLDGLTFQASGNLKLTDAIPGSSTEEVFTVTNPNSAARVRYSLKIVSDINDFSSEDGLGQLVITMSGDAGSESVDFTDSESVKEKLMFSDVELAPKESDDYHIKIEFAELGKGQNSNTEKNFVGHIEIIQTIVIDG